MNPRRDRRRRRPRRGHRHGPAQNPGQAGQPGSGPQPGGAAGDSQAEGFEPGTEPSEDGHDPQQQGASSAPQHAGPPRLAQRCHRQFQRTAHARGREYFLSKRVSEPTRVDDTFTFTVQGAGLIYNVVIDFSQVASTRSLHARCDCPYYQGGGLCKHVWAAVLQVDQAGLASAVPETGPLKVIHTNPRPAGGGQPRQHGGQHRGQPRPHQNIQGAALSGDWRERMDQIQAMSGSKPTSSLARSVAFFVVNASETASSGKLVLDLWSRDRLLNGDLGPLRPSRIQRNDVLRFEIQQDQEILALLMKNCEPQIFTPFSRFAGAASSRFRIDPFLEAYLLPLLTGANKLYISRSPNGSPDDAERALRIDRGSPWELELKLDSASVTNFRLSGVLRREGEARGLHEALYIFRNGFILFGDRISRISDQRHAPWVASLRDPAHELLVPKDQGDTLLKRLLTDSSAPRISWPDELGWKSVEINPRPIGTIQTLGNDPATGRMTLTVSFDYAGRKISLDDNERTFVDVEQKHVYPRNSAFEDQTLRKALEILRDRQGTGTFPSNELHRVASELTAAGWLVYIENKQLRVTENFAMNMTTSTDWFDLQLAASFGDTEARTSDILAALDAKNGMVRLADGSIGMLPPEWLERFASLKKIGQANEDGSIRFSKTQGLMLNAVLTEADRVKADDGFLTFREKVRKYEGVKSADAPKGFRGTLRNYQKDGLSWLRFLEEFEVGGILADDMGLGKTIQILAFLQDRARKNKKPNLVVAPKSLVFNWIDEAARFVPDLKVVKYSGDGRTKSLKEIPNADLVVTTYGTLRTDIEKLIKIDFDVAIVDEAQAIKNPKSLSALACKKINSSHRLALTGTPIENSVTDLFSILEFASPGLLSFSQEKDLNTDTKTALSKMLKPFVLRRTKEKVLEELPEKSEQVLYCEMSGVQKEFYTALRDRYRASLTKEIELNGMGKASMHVLEALLRLRQASCHPGLVDPAMGAETSAKLGLLLNQVREVIQEGHKALIFSQFTSLLGLVRESLDQEGIVYEYLDGQTTDRKKPVERFQTDPNCQLFLISLKAGGTGLNLTAAGYVFILDPWWNPAVEAQAIGRAHRMGQKQKIFAYRMIAKGTVEEKILELQKSKRELAESLISEDKDLRKLSREDLEMLLT